jgi:hypothetical protein
MNKNFNIEDVNWADYKMEDFEYFSVTLFAFAAYTQLFMA